MSWIWPILAIALIAMWTYTLVDIVRRRHERSGGKTAAWVIVVIIFPLLGTIAYFLVNGAGGGEAAPREPVP
jgi:predicted PurR-regulated permease PerM